MRVVIATDRSNDRETFRKASLSLGMECEAADCLSLDDLRIRLTKQPQADLTLVGVQPGANESLHAIEGATQQSKVPILAVGPLSDAQFIRQAQRAGAREYLDQEQLRDELSNAVEKLRTSGAVEFRQGRTIAVTSAHAGTGVSTIASGLAFGYAGASRGPVVLAELGVATPDLSLTLGLEPGHSPGDLVREPERLDVSMLRRALVSHAAGVELLGYQQGVLKATEIQPQPMRHLVALLRAVSDILVLDLGGGFTPGTLEALKLADSVLVVVRLDVPGVRLAHEHLKAIKEAGLAQDAIKVVGTATACAASSIGNRPSKPWAGRSRNGCRKRLG